jgi:hypothetical protein
VARPDHNTRRGRSGRVALPFRATALASEMGVPINGTPTVSSPDKGVNSDFCVRDRMPALTQRADVASLFGYVC